MNYNMMKRYGVMIIVVCIACFITLVFGGCTPQYRTNTELVNNNTDYVDKANTISADFIYNDICINVDGASQFLTKTDNIIIVSLVFTDEELLSYTMIMAIAELENQGYSNTEIIYGMKIFLEESLGYKITVDETIEYIDAFTETVKNMTKKIETYNNIVDYVYNNNNYNVVQYGEVDTNKLILPVYHISVK